MRRLREDVHIHAPASEVYARVAGELGQPDWMPPAFADLEVGPGALSFALKLPLRTERARLVVATASPPAYLEFAGSEAGDIALLAWAVNAEGPREVHVTLEAGYRPASGPLGALLEVAIQRESRRQALRDALWRLKLVAEGRE